MENSKSDRMLEIFFHGLRGEDISVQKLADEYGVSAKSVSRSMNDLKSFLANHRDLVGNTEFEYSYHDKCYRLHMDEFLTDRELFALVEVMIGARAFSKMELLSLVDKLQRFTTPDDRKKLKELISKEMYHYTEVRHDCESVEETLWKLINCITDRKDISIKYYRMDRAPVEHRLLPASIMFADHYFYLIAYKAEDEEYRPTYFRVDRITHITEHRKSFSTDNVPDFDEGLLRRRSLFMFPGKLRTIRFEFSGPSVQAVLDKLPTAKVIERKKGKYLIEAEVYGDGIKMWLLSQGTWVRVVSPDDFVTEMKQTVSDIMKIYDNEDNHFKNAGDQ